MKLSKEVLQKIRHLEIHTRRLLQGLVTGDYSSSKKGFGLDFDQLRDYQVGDDVRCIDWKSTARSDKLLVRQYKEDHNRTIMIVVDASASMLYGSSDELKSELAAQIASVLALSAEYTRDYVGMIVGTGHDDITIYPPSRGRTHIHSLMEHLFTIKASGTVSLQMLLQEVLQYKQKNMIVCIISDFIDTDYEATLKLVSKRHATIALHCYDTVEKQVPAFGMLTVQDPETMEKTVISTKDMQLRSWLEQHHELAKRMCVQSRVDYLALETGKPFMGDLIKFFSKQMR